jgi:hypothetical protein
MTSENPYLQNLLQCRHKMSDHIPSCHTYPASIARKITVMHSNGWRRADADVISLVAVFVLSSCCALIICNTRIDYDIIPLA